jgi:type VI secretion system secreted protein Hcp
MPSKFLMNMILSKQGQVKGSITKKGSGLDYGKGIECHAFEYAVTGQYDAGSGQLSGRRTHKPVTIVREVDSASPLLWQALCTNEGFVTATLSFARPSSGGKLTLAYTIELTNGTISNVNQYNPGKIGGGKKWEKVTLIYEDLKVNGLKDGIIPRSIMG